ncbi:tetratricopeptide repeat protein [Algivirga pacifica]|uniref:Tetratricopeptide repeat-containing protein n=1 Tax=Algivirga pacifica TaxID=1162670 RepID=A0ABP9DM61_9BACT
MMSKSQYILIAIGVVFVAGLMFMPRAVVRNNDKQVKEATTASATENTANTTHSETIPEDKKERIAQLQANIQQATEQEALPLLDKLIAEWKMINRYDSAAVAAEDFYTVHTKQPYLLNAADLYYEAFTFAVNTEKVAQMGAKARGLYEKYLEKSPEDLDAKVKLGVTYVSTEAPMKGIFMIREVLKKDPNHKLALFNLGTLSLQSNQFDKAVGRFKKLVDLDSEDIQSRFYLAVCYKELGDKDKAIQQLNIVKEKAQDAQIIATVDKYLTELEAK